jgi:hypothetical protein
MIRSNVNDGTRELMKRGTMIVMVLVLFAVVFFVGAPWFREVFKGEELIKSIPELKKTVDKLETSDRAAEVDRKDIRRDIRDLERRMDRNEAVQDRVMPRTVAPPPGWETVTVPARRKDGT